MSSKVQRRVFAAASLGCLLLAAGLAVSAAGSQPEPFFGERQAGRPITELSALIDAAIRLPVATVFGAALAFRPRRRGTPKRSPGVIQTQIILAIVGCLIMLIVGTSIARAFGIVGAAGLIRYRSKIEDPKDAAVMLSALGVGLATGVGLLLLSSFATLFILAVLLLVESLQEGHKLFELKVKSEELPGLRDRIESLLSRNGIDYELRSASEHEICYEVKLPLESGTDRVSDAILRLDPRESTAVEWEEKKVKP
jgi:uncharacterized membrane protein YhiD involved in acid resistance